MMKSKVFLLLSTDWHLKRENIDDIIDLFRQKCQLAKKYNLNKIFCLGDIFDSRISQRIDVLLAFLKLLNICVENDIKLYAIPGNHDKTNYQGKESFINPFSYHPNLVLVDEYLFLDESGYRVHLIPFFDENNVYKNVLKRVVYGERNILLSHIAITGSVNNDGTMIDNELKINDFKKFDRVFLGHYHNTHEIGKNIVHIPSIKQNNFGENSLKGFTVVGDDLNHEFIRSKFRLYKKHEINLKNLSREDLNDTLQAITNEDCYNRVVFIGDKQQLSADIVSDLHSNGVDVKFRKENIAEQSKSENVSNFQLYKESDVIEYFKLFCNENSLDYNEGLPILEKTIKNNSLLSA